MNLSLLIGVPGWFLILVLIGVPVWLLIVLALLRATRPAVRWAGGLASDAEASLLRWRQFRRAWLSQTPPFKADRTCSRDEKGNAVCCVECGKQLAAILQPPSPATVASDVPEQKKAPR